MTSRVLETVLTGTDLLSPVLGKAGANVAAFNAQVAAGSARSAETAGASAVRQEAAAEKIAASNLKASTSATSSAAIQSRAHEAASRSSSLSSRAQVAANDALARSNGLLGTSLTPLTAGLGAVALGLGYAAYKGMTFDSSMSQVQAATQASSATLGQLREVAIKAGADTQYSAVEAAQGITEMAKAGVSAADIMSGGLAGALNLAAAGQISVADAAETGATALSVFGLEGNKMSHVADLLAAGAGKAQGSVGDMSQALNQSALVANQMGLSVEDTAGALALFAHNGLIGSDAGTSFKTMLQALTPNSEQAAAAMDAIGFSAYDSQGKFVGLQNVAEQLRTGLAGLSEEQRNATLKTIFGADAVRAASVLYKEGATGVAQWARNVNDAGYAQRQAAENTNNLRGDLERLGGAADSFFTNLGEGTQGPLRETVQMFTGLVNAGGDVLGFFNNLPGPMQAAVIGFAAWALAGDRVVGLYGGLRDKLAAFREEAALQRALFAAQSNDLTDVDRALGGLGTTVETTGNRFGAAKAAVGQFARAIGPELAIGLAVAGVALLVDDLNTLVHAGDAASGEVKDLNRSLSQIDDNASRIDATASAITNLKNKLADAQEIVDQGVLGQEPNWVASLLGVSAALADQGAKYKDAQESANIYKKAIADLQQQQDNAEASTKALSQQYGITSSDVLRLADTYGIDLTAGVESVNRVFVNSGAAAEVASGAVTSVGNAAGMTQAQIEASAKALEDWRGQLQQIGESFVEPLGVYQELLQQKQDAERAAAEATAAATKSSSDSWKDYVTESKVSLDEWATALQQQITDQDNWRTNIVTITQRGGLEVGQIFAAMGVEGASQAAQMANATDAEFQRMAGLLIQDAHNGGAGAAAALDTQMKVMAAIAASGGQATVQGIAQQLGLGVGVVAGIVQQYSSTLAGGINPLLSALGKPTVAGYHVAGINGPGGTTTKNADGNLYEQHQAEIAPGGAMRVWAEPETGGEAYIPLAPSKRARSMGIWRETGKRLGAPEVQYFGSGGFAEESDVPAPFSTSPYRLPISTAGDAAMDSEHDATVKFVRENGPWGRALAWAKSQVGKPYVWGGVGPGGYDCSGFMSAITNVILGRSPYSRVGSTASFPWKGFASGYGEFTIGSTPNAGGGIGHMAGTLHGVNVESRGGTGVVVGGSARGASNGLFSTRAHLAMFNGGVIAEPVIGLGTRSGRSYSFAEHGPETVTPGAPTAMRGYSSAFGSRGGGEVVVVEKRTEIAVDASNRDHRAIANAIAAKQREDDFLSG